MSGDPTAFDLHTLDDEEKALFLEEQDIYDPRVRRIRAWSSHGNRPFDVPFITPLADNLWHGGVETGLVLPHEIVHVVSLYPWERYTTQKRGLRSFLEVLMYDSEDQGFEQVEDIARWVNSIRDTGPVLVHCQAGLNRSSLVVAKAMILAGDVANGQEAIDKIRAARSDVCLCNPAFERWVRAQ